LRATANAAVDPQVEWRQIQERLGVPKQRPWLRAATSTLGPVAVQGHDRHAAPEVADLPEFRVVPKEKVLM
jgi:hypothetical protein